MEDGAGELHHDVLEGHGGLHLIGAQQQQIAGSGSLPTSIILRGQHCSQRGRGCLFLDFCGQKSRGASVAVQNPQVMERKYASSTLKKSTIFVLPVLSCNPYISVLLFNTTSVYCQPSSLTHSLLLLSLLLSFIGGL